MVQKWSEGEELGFNTLIEKWMPNFWHGLLLQSTFDLPHAPLLAWHQTDFNILFIQSMLMEIIIDINY